MFLSTISKDTIVSPQPLSAIRREPWERGPNRPASAPTGATEGILPPRWGYGRLGRGLFASAHALGYILAPLGGWGQLVVRPYDL